MTAAKNLVTMSIPERFDDLITAVQQVQFDDCTAEEQGERAILLFRLNTLRAHAVRVLGRKR